MTKITANGWLRLCDVERRLGVSRMTIRRWEAAGEFPRQTPGQGWRVADVDAWLRPRRRPVGRDSRGPARLLRLSVRPCHACGLGAIVLTRPVPGRPSQHQQDDRPDHHDPDRVARGQDAEQGQQRVQVHDYSRTKMTGNEHGAVEIVFMGSFSVSKSRTGGDYLTVSLRQPSGNSQAHSCRRCRFDRE